MGSASIHDKLARVRKPRVHITYEVETEGADGREGTALRRRRPGRLLGQPDRSRSSR